MPAAHGDRHGNHVFLVRCLFNVQFDAIVENNAFKIHVFDCFPADDLALWAPISIGKFEDFFLLPRLNGNGSGGAECGRKFVIRIFNDLGCREVNLWRFHDSVPLGAKFFVYFFNSDPIRIVVKPFQVVHRICHNVFIVERR